MPASTATAPGKIILFGEHAVVYDRPAIAVPVFKVSARAVVTPGIGAPPGQINILAQDIGIEAEINDLLQADPIRKVIEILLAELQIDRPPAFNLQISSTIPIAAGMGSGAAVSVAIIRVISGFLGYTLADEVVSKLAYEVERLHHGTPSGIDNSVVTYGKPIFFVRQQPIEQLQVGEELNFVIADTGIASPTAIAVRDLKQAWLAEQRTYDKLFDEIADIVNQARKTIAIGNGKELGRLLDKNHEILSYLGVSSPELNNLCVVAREAGALGAKLSGAGRGGNMIAIVDSTNVEEISHALTASGAKRTIITSINAD